jgi:Aspartyl protease
MQAFLRLSLIIAIILSCTTWHAPRAHCASSETKLPVEVPLQTGDPLYTVEVMVNGQGPFVFAFDTGAQGDPRIDVSLVEKLKLKSTGQVQATDPSRRNFQASETYKVDSLAVGNLRLTDVTVIGRNFQNSPRPLKVDGVLGLHAFADYLVTLDFPGQKLRLDKGELPKPDGAEILDYKNDAGIALIELAVGDKKIQARLDTGNGIGAFVFPTAFAEKLTFAGEPRVVGRARSATGDTEIKQVQLKEVIKLGRHEFPDAMIVYPALGDLGNVGLKTLSEFTMTFDQQHQRVRLKRRS